MYSKEATIPLKISTSYLPHNLTLHYPSITSKPLDYQNVQYATISKNILNITQPKNETSSLQIIFKPENFPNILDMNRQLNPFILQAKWCLFGSTTYLILCCYHIILIYDEKGSNLLSAHPILYIAPKLNSPYANSIAIFGNFLCIGLGNNEISILQLKSQGGNENLFEDFITLQGHKGPISCLCTDSEGNLLSGDDTGMICAWKLTEFSKPISSPVIVLNSSDNPCTGVAYCGKYVIAAFGSGQIKLFNKDRLELDFEINAHARWINAIDVCQKLQWILAVSEDTCVSIWRLPNKGNSTVECLYYQTIESCVLTGGQFVDEDGAAIALSAYDLSEVMIYKLTAAQDEV